MQSYRVGSYESITKSKDIGGAFGGEVSPFVGIKKEYAKSRLTYSFVYKVYKPNDFLVFYFCNLSALSFNLAARASLSGWVENICCMREAFSPPALESSTSFVNAFDMA